MFCVLLRVFVGQGDIDVCFASLRGDIDDVLYIVGCLIGTR